MAKKISQLTELDAIDGNESVPVALNGQTYKVRLHKIKTLISKADLGLEHVDNTGDLEKPVSTATQSALNQKAERIHGHTIQDVDQLTEVLNDKADQDHTHEINDINQLTQALNGKADQDHTHAIQDIDQLSQVLEDKANQNHAHAIQDITGLETQLLDIVDLVSHKAHAVHGHTTDDIQNLSNYILQTVNQAPGIGDVTVTNIEW